MPEISEEVEFNLGADQLKFTTRTNGDTLLITGLHLTKEQAASLAYLVNSQQDLKVEVSLI